MYNTVYDALKILSEDNWQSLLFHKVYCDDFPLQIIKINK